MLDLHVHYFCPLFEHSVATCFKLFAHREPMLVDMAIEHLDSSLNRDFAWDYSASCPSYQMPYPEVAFCSLCFDFPLTIHSWSFAVWILCPLCYTGQRCIWTASVASAFHRSPSCPIGFIVLDFQSSVFSCRHQFGSDFRRFLHLAGRFHHYPVLSSSSCPYSSCVYYV